jgi:hypothetical protein
LKRAGDTRWGSHYNSICSLISMFDATCSVLEIIRREWANYSQQGDANAAYKMVTSFEFIFILHLMKEIMGITDVLCQALQQKSQDILNAINSVSTAKKTYPKAERWWLGEIAWECCLFFQEIWNWHPRLKCSLYWRSRS